MFLPLTSLILLLGGCAAHHFPVVKQIPQSSETEQIYRAQYHFIQARDYERRGLVQMAERFYEMAYENDSNSKILRQILLNNYMQSGSYSKALILLKGDRELSALDLEERRQLVSIYLRMGELAKAAEVLETIDEKSEEEIYSLGLVYESMGKKDKALQNYGQFFSGNPRSLGIGIKLVQFNIAEQRFADAESLCVILQKNFPQSADVLSLAGVIKRINHDTTAALDLLNQALVLDSLNEEALRSIAHLHIARGEQQEAVDVYRKLVAQEAIGAPYRRGLAFLLFHIKEFKESEKLLDDLVTENPDDSELRFYRGLIYASTDRDDSALEEYEKALELDPQNEELWREYSYMHILGKDVGKAEDVVDRFLSNYPNSGAAWRFKGYVLNMQEKHSEASEALRKAVEIDSTDFYAWFELGSALERLKNFDEAAKSFRTVLALKPNDAAASNYLGYMWAEKGVNLDSAEILIKVALDQEPSNGAYLDSYAWVLYQLKRYDEAYKYMKDAVERMSEDPLLFSHLGDILFELKDFSSAAQAYRKSLDLNSTESDRIRNRLIEINYLIQKERL